MVTAAHVRYLYVPMARLRATSCAWVWLQRTLGKHSAANLRFLLAACRNFACLGFVVFPLRFSLNRCAVSYTDGSGIPRDPRSLRHRLVCFERAAVVKELTRQAGTDLTIYDMPMYFVLLSLKGLGDFISVVCCSLINSSDLVSAGFVSLSE